MTPILKIRKSELIAAAYHLADRGRIGDRTGNDAIHYVRQRIYEKLHIIDINKAIEDDQPVFVFSGFCILVTLPLCSSATGAITIQVIPYVVPRVSDMDAMKFIDVSNGDPVDDQESMTAYMEKLEWPPKKKLSPVKS